MADTTKFHPALAVTNVKSLIPITLDMEHGLYHSWSALFINLVTVHDLHHHIIPPTEDAAIAAYNATKAADPALWKRLDAAVLQWIYGTLSTDLLQAILRRADTAQGAWSRLESMFQDNKASRATHLEEELTNLNFENFSSIDSYCNHMKSIADRLADVDAPVSNSRLVLRLTGGLPEAYSGTVDIIQNQEPLPSFESCRSRLKLAERTIKNRLAKEGASSVQSALVTTSTPAAVSSSTVHRSFPNNNKNKNKNKNKRNGPSSLTGNTQHSLPHSGPKWQPSPWTNWAPWFSQWPNTPPPCPYPASSWAPRPASGPRPSGPGILGPRPQAYSATSPSMPTPFGSYTPTDIEAAMSALTTNASDGTFYMDTGATSHMTSDQGLTDGSPTSAM